MACHWDLVGIMGPWDPNTSKWACKTVKKPIMNVDNLEDAGNRTIPSPVMDLVASAFAVWNTANALVTESASIQGTFIRFHEQIATSLDRCQGNSPYLLFSISLFLSLVFLLHLLVALVVTVTVMVTVM
jgi:hypothetical protein